jgi:group I intron endonuclease
MPRSIRKPGIYKITNKINNKFYIGSSALNVQYRWSDHLSQMRTQIHPNRHLQRAFNKYGEESFTHEVLELCSAEDCIVREQYYIDLLNPHYNICRIAGNSLGQKRSEETRRKIGLSKKGHQYAKGRVWSQASRDKLTASLKDAYSSGRVKPHGLKATPEQKEKIRAKLQGNNNRRNSPTYRNIEQYDTKGNFIALHFSISAAAEAVGCSKSSVDVSINKGKVRLGFIFKLKDNVKLGELLEQPEAVNQQPS